MTSVYELVLANGPEGWYDPSAFFLNGTTTNLNPVVGERFQEPWKLTYKFKESASNLLSIGAECAWNTVAGATIFDLQVASVNVELGASRNGSPTASPVKSLDFHTAKHVGYPYQLLFGFVMSPR